MTGHQPIQEKLSIAVRYLAIGVLLTKLLVHKGLCLEFVFDFLGKGDVAPKDIADLFVQFLDALAFLQEPGRVIGNKILLYITP